ncbi:sigma-E factor negative regulatory protein [Dyella tabacisoli]|uniref:Anti-anti-sigma factor n=1 Tax=Dyella tabacisoli TaxID=2282381 RepID=A0A369URJ9_9GAMM|nr:sigma-E factor negative regulatory protein [Dyella tabacisoli]RDD83286.1 anti-anti-sigma factor [Dyella tabacisoli]
MTESHRENLSVGMDGELSAEQLRFLLRRLDHDEPLQQAWSRYHVARDGLRHELPPLAKPGFAARVMLAIEQEAAAAQPAERRHWLRWSAGGAIAASVAVAALMVTQPVGPDAGHAMPRVAASTQGMTTATGAAAQADSPATAPPWLSNYTALPSQLSQQASATLDGNDGTQLFSPNHLTPYQLSPKFGQRPRTINNGDGSYLLLIHPDQQTAPNASRQVPAAAR